MNNMTEIYDLQVIKHKPIFSDEFFNNYIKGHNFDLYEVTTSYRQINELYEDHRDLVLTNIQHDIVNEIIRESLNLPLASDEHGQIAENQLVNGFSINELEENVNEALPDYQPNEFEQMLDHISKTYSNEYGNRHETYFDNYWLLTVRNTDKTCIIDAFNLNGSKKSKSNAADTTGLYLLNEKRKHENEQILADKHNQIKDAQFNEAVRLINKLSKDDKIKLLKLLLK